MQAAIFGLIGTAIGGAITIIVAIIKFRQEISLWKQQFQRQNELERDKLKLERYAGFLGAYYYIEGAIEDLIDILDQAGDDAASRLSLVVSDPTFEKACATINNEKGWIALVSNSVDIVHKINELEKAQDQLFSIGSKAKTEGTDLNEILQEIRLKQQEIKPIATSVVALLKDDAKST
ncbi:hypothetical protein ATO7_06150 [Oceanococcus atlanticus]|uniref:Uncharacterized protein n=1 Tax=Oceanococcus atlanticus TaxID=1317117 RepID=A0A1Y1SJR4_9GAMM|nr:hypothetical protein [Oceanococcus atlanticus]ORE89439.1 hypothetical protein ATO7_06150 [Oceanococcus atlanticus]